MRPWGRLTAYDARVPDSTQDSVRRRTLAQRLRRTATRLAASRQRHEVVEAVGQAESDEAATAAVSDLLDVDAAAASEVIEMPVKSFTKDRVADLEVEHDLLQKKLATLPPQDS